MHKIVLILTLVLSSSCASIVSKSNYPVALDSDPSGIMFTITNRSGEVVQSGVTPEEVALDASSGYFKRASYRIVLPREGLDDKVYTLSSSMDGWYWGNILFGGILGMLVIDPLTGAMFKLPPEVNVPLNAPPGTEMANVIKIRFATIDAPIDENGNSTHVMN